MSEAEEEYLLSLNLALLWLEMEDIVDGLIDNWTRHQNNHLGELAAVLGLRLDPAGEGRNELRQYTCGDEAGGEDGL